MDLFLSVHLQEQYLLITLLINLLILFKWTLLERSLRSLLRSLVIKSLIDNIFIERLGFSAYLCIYFYWLSWLRQASHRKLIQNSALRLRLRRFKILTCPLLKGQLISKCLFGVFNFSQKTNENKSTWGIIIVKLIFFVRFSGELRIPKVLLKLTDL